MPARPVSAGVIRRINAEFQQRYPELLSRLRRIVRRFRDDEDVLAEMTSFAFLNFRSVFLRRGQCLTPCQMAFMCWLRAKSGRTLEGGGTCDVHDPLAQLRGRARVIHLSVLSCSKRQQVLPDSTVDHIVAALTTSEKDRPDVRAAVRLDWGAFARTLPSRLRRILAWLVIGASKTWIARKLGISKGRVSQLLDKLGQEVVTFFGPEFAPARCVA